MYQFGWRSKRNLKTCDPRLQTILEEVLAYGHMDFSVIEGHRTEERQQELYRNGFSKKDGLIKMSKHQLTPSMGVDLLPYPNSLNGVSVWRDNMRFHILAGMIYAAAARKNVKIRWGGDWDGDGNAADQIFNDLAHFELVG